jgi:hypothetical protein
VQPFVRASSTGIATRRPHADRPRSWRPNVRRPPSTSRSVAPRVRPATRSLSPVGRVMDVQAVSGMTSGSTWPVATPLASRSSAQDACRFRRAKTRHPGTTMSLIVAVWAKRGAHPGQIRPALTRCNAFGTISWLRPTVWSAARSSGVVGAVRRSGTATHYADLRFQPGPRRLAGDDEFPTTDRLLVRGTR